MGKREDLLRAARDAAENDGLGLPDGLQPSPFDRRYSKRGGSSFALLDGQSDSVSNESEYITDWVIKFRPSADGVATVAGGEGFGVRGAVYVQYDGEQFLEYQPASNPTLAPFALPLVGKCFQVHGRVITFRLQRTMPGASNALKVEAAIVPGRVATWFQTVPGVAQVNNSSLIPIPIFATRFQLFVTLTVGDIIQQLDASGAGVLQSVAATTNNLNYLQPIDPNAAFLRLITADVAAKVVQAGFEVIS